MYWMTNDGPTNWTRCGYHSDKKRDKKLNKVRHKTLTASDLLSVEQDKADIEEAEARHRAQKYTPWF